MSRRAPPIVLGDASYEISRLLARRLRAKHIRTDARTFGDGETKVTLRGAIPRNSTVLVVQSTHPPVDSNLLRALTLVSEAAASSRKVVAIVPYMGYARQDRAFLSGEIVTMRHIARMFKNAGASSIIMVDIHSAEALEHFDIPATSIAAAPALAAQFAKMRLRNCIIVSPDAGARERAEIFAGELACDYLVLDKKRNRKTGKVSIVTRSAAEVRDRDVILVDDMISSGSSLAKAATFLKKHGCRKVYAACTHALLVDGARTRMSRAGITRIISANTIPGPTASADVSELIANALNL